jgi:type I restriction enzyme, R subunit
VNDLFAGDLTDEDKLVYVNNVIKGKLFESVTLQQQAMNNSKQQFDSSPDLKNELLNAIISALDAHTAMSRQALTRKRCRTGSRTFCSPTPVCGSRCASEPPGKRSNPRGSGAGHKSK